MSGHFFVNLHIFKLCGSMKYVLGLKKLPFEQNKKQIIYVEGEYNKNVNHYIQKNYNTITQYFRCNGFEFCYIPYLAKELANSMSMRYYAPFAPNDFKPNTNLTSDALLDFMINRRGKNKIEPALLYYHPNSFQDDYVKANKQFLAITLTPDSGYEKTDNFSVILDEIQRDMSYYDGLQPKSRIVEWNAIEEFLDQLDCERRKKMETFIEMSRELRRDGAERWILATMAYGNDVEVSPIKITKDFRIVLEKINKEVDLDALPKTVFLFYLNHPEGVSTPYLVDYKNELRAIYLKLLGRVKTTEEIEKSIKALTDYSNSNSIYEKINTIKTTFESIMDERIASNYCIIGKRKQPKKIGLSKEQIIWECDMVPATHPVKKTITKVRSTPNKYADY